MAPVQLRVLEGVQMKSESLKHVIQWNYGALLIRPCCESDTTHTPPPVKYRRTTIARLYKSGGALGANMYSASFKETKEDRYNTILGEVALLLIIGCLNYVHKHIFHNHPLDYPMRRIERFKFRVPQDSDSVKGFKLFNPKL
jgi:hypothetical protein